MPTALKSVITTDTFFHQKPRLKGCNNRKPLSVLKPQHRKLKYKLSQNRTKNNAKPHHRKPLRPPPHGLFPRRWRLPYENVGMLVISLRGVNQRFWSHLGCSGLIAIIFSILRMHSKRKQLKKTLSFPFLGLIST